MDRGSWYEAIIIFFTLDKMNTKSFFPFMLIFMALSMSGCELVGDILEFGFWVGIIVVILVVAIIAWIVRKLRRP